MPITNKKPAAGQRDAVCFTAGANGIAFGAGVVHAYLASDRAPPLVAAGISGGAINAAALQRCYQDLAKAKAGIEREIARWTWYRKYLDLLINEPMSVIWDGLPDQSDFYADMPPVKDPTPALFQNPEAQAECTSRSGAKMLVPIDARPVMFTPPFCPRSGKKFRAEA